MRFPLFLFSLLLPLSFYSCHGDEPVNEKQAEECVQAFAEDFFSFKYKEALANCSESSKKQFLFYISNISHNDIDSIRKIPVLPTIHVRNVEKLDNDSTAEAVCKVENFYFLDSLDRPGRYVEEALFDFNLVIENGVWKVRRVSLRQSEK